MPRPSPDQRTAPPHVRRRGVTVTAPATGLRPMAKTRGAHQSPTRDRLRSSWLGSSLWAPETAHTTRDLLLHRRWGPERFAGGAAFDLPEDFHVLGLDGATGAVGLVEVPRTPSRHR